MHQRIYILGSHSEEHKQTYSKSKDAVVNIDTAGSDFDALWDITQDCQGNSDYHESVSERYLDGLRLKERTEEVMELNHCQYDKTNNSFDQDEFNLVLQEQSATEEDVSETPHHGRNQEEEEKPLLPLPRTVQEQDDN